MESNAERVRAFHRAVGLDAPDRPTLPTQALLDLRRTLIREETAEVMEAFGALEREDGEAGSEADFARLVHELTDLLYVTYGALLAFGVEPDAVFEEVHEANMRKTAGPRRADGKQLKPEGWRPADVAGVLGRQATERLPPRSRVRTESSA